MTRATPLPAPVIYNLFPLLAGPFDHWGPHLERAAAMGCDWLYFNPVSYPGFSGSLYSVKDYDGFHPLLWGDDRDGARKAFAGVLARMGELGMRPMMDLVINHTAIDCPLIGAHPAWYLHDAAGRIVHPGAKDGERMVYWGDLASIDNAHSADRDGLWAYWDALIARHQRMGVKGFRCDAAYHVPTELWRHLIGRARQRDPAAAFFAETLGCEIDDVIALADAGFDFTFNSSKWWDFQAPWCLDQHEAARHVAPSVSFAESHDTERLGAECHGDATRILARHAFACLFSTGVMLPMGLEFGATHRLNVVTTRPDHLDRPLDLTIPVGELHALKRAHRVFQADGPVRRIDLGPGACALAKGMDGAPDHALLTIGGRLDRPAPEPPPGNGWTEATPACLGDHPPLRVFLPTG